MVDPSLSFSFSESKVWGFATSLGSKRGDREGEMHAVIDMIAPNPQTIHFL
jgi:hypothetical protein